LRVALRVGATQDKQNEGNRQRDPVVHGSDTFHGGGSASSFTVTNVVSYPHTAWWIRTVPAESDAIVTPDSGGVPGRMNRVR